MDRLFAGELCIALFLALSIHVHARMDIDAIDSLCQSIECAEACIVSNGSESTAVSDHLNKTLTQTTYVYVGNVLDNCILTRQSLLVFYNMPAQDVQLSMDKMSQTQLQLNLLAIMSPVKDAEHYFKNHTRALTPRMVLFFIDISDNDLLVTQGFGTAMANQLEFKVPNINFIRLFLLYFNEFISVLGTSGKLEHKRNHGEDAKESNASGPAFSSWIWNLLALHYIAKHISPGFGRNHGRLGDLVCKADQHDSGVH